MISICFPAFNEEENVGKTIEETVKVMENLPYNWEILVVNDGSKDGTEKAVLDWIKKNKHVRIYNHPKNLGYAVATKNCLLQSKGDIIFVIDSDRQHTMNDIPQFIDTIKKGYDIVVGWKKERNDPLPRVVMSKFYNFIFCVMFSSGLHDVDCGFRCFTRKAAEKINIEYAGVPVGPEIFAKALKMKMKIAEVVVKHYPRKAGKSVFQPTKLPKQVFKTLKSLVVLKMELAKWES